MQIVLTDMRSIYLETLLLYRHIYYKYNQHIKRIKSLNSLRVIKQKISKHLYTQYTICIVYIKDLKQESN